MFRGLALMLAAFALALVCTPQGQAQTVVVPAPPAVAYYPPPPAAAPPAVAVTTYRYGWLPRRYVARTYIAPAPLVSYYSPPPLVVSRPVVVRYRISPQAFPFFQIVLD
jgi:hypothetical protein